MSAQVIPFRPRSVAPAPEPTTDQINSVLIACLVTGLSRPALTALHGRMQRMYDRAANNPERRQLVSAAADCIGFKLGRAAS